MVARRAEFCHVTHSLAQMRTGGGRIVGDDRDPTEYAPATGSPAVMLFVTVLAVPAGVEECISRLSAGMRRSCSGGRWLMPRSSLGIISDTWLTRPGCAILRRIIALER